MRSFLVHVHLHVHAHAYVHAHVHVASGQVQQFHVALAMREGAVVGVACLALVARSKRAPAPWGAEVLRVSRASYSLLYVVSTQST